MNEEIDLKIFMNRKLKLLLIEQIQEIYLQVWDFVEDYHHL